MIIWSMATMEIIVILKLSGFWFETVVGVKHQ